MNVSIKLLNLIFPRGKIVEYQPKKDAFYSFLSLTLESGELGQIELDMDLKRGYLSEEWRVGKLFCSTSLLPKEVANKLREKIQNNTFGLISLLEEEVKKIKLVYPNKSLELGKVFSKFEYADKEGRYKEHFIVNVEGLKEPFFTFVKKTKLSDNIVLEVLPQLDKKYYERYFPGWKKQLTHLVLTYWLEKDSSILNKQEKEIYLKKSFQRKSR